MYSQKQKHPKKMTGDSFCGKQFSDCCDEWMDLNRLRVSESTYVKYYSVINKHLKPAFGEYGIGDMTSFAVEAFSESLLFEKNLSPKTVKDILVLLKSILAYIRRRYPGVSADIEIVYPKDRKKEVRVLTWNEQKRFMEYLLRDMDGAKFGVLLSLMTGLRVGEVCALRWSDISLEEKIIRVGSTMQRIKNMEGSSPKTKVIISSPKSDSSVRMIPLTDYTVELCRLMKSSKSDAFVLSGSPDFYIEPRALQYKLKQYTQECGLEGVHYHTLRHSFATRCVEVGFEIKSLSEIMGHSTPQITLERYVHSSIELKRSNMNKLTKLCL